MKVLVTGGTGFIGSHTVVELLENQHEVVIVDNLANSSRAVLGRIQQITGKQPTFIEADITNEATLLDIFQQHAFDAVMHFAALKAVHESVAEPLNYYRNNVGGLLTILQCMEAAGVTRLVFSSSCTVYGDPETVPLTEAAPIGSGIANPYGQSKVMCELIMTDCAKANPKLQLTSLRYFNPAGAHPSGLIGEDPEGPPNNLVPFISQAAVGKRKEVMVFGNDYPTNDGTGVRDYIHVVDLAQGHLAALGHSPKPGNVDVYNLGSGTGYSVLEIIHAYEKACGKQIPYTITGRRPGDIAETYADPIKAKRELNWHTMKTLDDICADAWRWQSMNPNGFDS